MQRRDFIRTTSAGAAFLTAGGLAAFRPASAAVSPYAMQSSRKLPLAFEVDVVVAGGSTAGVAAAAKAAQQGAKVLLVAPEPYLGEDLCATFRLWRDEKQPVYHPLEDELFGQGGFATPMHIKKVLDDVLIQNKVQFLYATFVTDLIVDEHNRPAGVVIANRSGRQAVRAKVIIDATPRAMVARMGNARFEPFRPGKHRFEWITVGNKNRATAQTVALPDQLMFGGKKFPVWKSTFDFELKDDSFASFAEAEQKARDLTWDAEQVESSEKLFGIPRNRLIGKKRLNNSGIHPGEINPGVFQPKKTENLFVLSGAASFSDEVAEALLRPGALIAAGDRIGAAAAIVASNRASSQQLTVAGEKIKEGYPGDVKELLEGLRSSINTGMVSSPDRGLPVLGSYDVLVLGGGTSGAPAGLGAARKGAKTLVLEYLHGLGGTGTMGMIGRYYHGYREGFTNEVDLGTKTIGGDSSRQKKRLDEWVFDWKTEWFRSEIRKAGGEIWFGVLGCGAYVEGNQVKGLVVATPFGRGVILAHTVIDSTGSADTAIAAGAGYTYTDGYSVAIQGAGLSPKNPNDFYNNTDWTFTDDTDLLDVWRTFVQAKAKYPGQFDLGQLPQTRERRKVIGDFTVGVLDVYNGRTYPDTISVHWSSFDTHGFTEHPFFSLKPPAHSGEDVLAYVPFRALLPKGLEGIVVTGLGASADRDAMPVIRMQPCLQNQGYAVGIASAMVKNSWQMIRYVDIRALQKELISIGNMKAEVGTFTGNFPPAFEKLQLAAKTVVHQLEGLEILLWEPERAVPLLTGQYLASQKEDDKLVYARILGLLKNPAGVETLMKAIDGFEDWDKGWNYRGMGQFGMSMSYLDSLVIALGNSRKKEAIPSIVRLAKKLTPDSYFSHFRAVAVAFEALGSREAAPVLYELLHMPGMRGHAMTDIEKALTMAVPDRVDTSTRNASLKEIFMGRALFKIGDMNGLGNQIMQEYAKDLRGHYYRHATGVLKLYGKIQNPDVER